ncbi:MAG: hypothetical protein GY856_10545, partial [bacterium]|nr:hypothetical protein [bacterium]
PEALELKTGYVISAGVAVGDVDGDGDIEVVAGGADANPPTAGALYAWDFSSGVASERPWPVFRHNTDNRAWIDNGSIFADGFESGDTTAWSSATP